MDINSVDPVERPVIHRLETNAAKADFASGLGSPHDWAGHPVLKEVQCPFS